MAVVHRINVSPGGVPKLPVPTAMVDASGLVGDEQADRVHHGHPEQAICLYSLEVIHALREEGHPIEPGSAGDNLTLSGLDWEAVVPGSRLKIGETIEIEVTGYTSPCVKNAGWFLERDFNRMSQTDHPGWSRLYARVLEPGEVSVGDAVVLAQ